MRVSDILSVLEQFAPYHLQLAEDNVGLLVGDPATAVSHVRITLDITPEVAREAVSDGVDLLVSHHPVIYKPLAAVVPGNYSGDAVITLIKAGISAICMHTNLDAAPVGVNDTLAAVLGLVNIAPIDDGGQGILRLGSLSSAMEPREFAEHVGKTLGCQGLRFVAGNRPVHRVAVCGGSGGNFQDASYAVAADCDAYVTSELKYSAALELLGSGITIVDAGHFHTENPVCKTLYALLAGAFPELKLSFSTHDDPMEFITFP